MNTLTGFNIVKNRKNPTCFKIPIIEEELRFRFVRIPIKHRALLWIPGMCFIDWNDCVILLSINENDGRRFFSQWHSVYGIDFHGKDVASTRIPRNRLTLANVTKKVMPFS